MTGVFPLRHKDAGFLLETAETAAREIMRVYSGGFEVDLKGGIEPVTQADRAADALIVQALAARFPGDAILSEENGLQDVGRTGRRAWFIDPVDGTKEFIKRNGEFAVQIGMSVDAALELGIVLQPATGDVWMAARGEGCHHRQAGAGWSRVIMPDRGGKPLVLAISRSHPSMLAVRAAKAVGGGQQLERGGVGLKLMAIAAGAAHFYLNDSNSTKAWDIAAPELLFTEAGGIVTDLRGDPFRYDVTDYRHRCGLLASSDPALHDRLLEFVRRERPV
ncbi:MAG TPA: 3'(2'),5'-bisphosphate nucleotidase CysQ [Candidatus Ozemobacteraceae bacterium]|nr:3'(2'),5'-bisphosphate nucleotidase CysQ [Candidatus Ozemobacteraceae bacterium]